MAVLNAEVIPYSLPFTIYQGATFNPTLLLKDKESGDEINLTGCTARMKANRQFTLVLNNVKVSYGGYKKL
jgi:hypothetical protein